MNKSIKRLTRTAAGAITLMLLMLLPMSAYAAFSVQCPATPQGPDFSLGRTNDPAIACRHITGGDGFIAVADFDPAAVNFDDAYEGLYMFGFCDTSDPSLDVMEKCMLGANFPAPTIEVREGDEFYLTLSNVGMLMRPDLFDPHSVHFHGFPNASAVFDGEPMSTTSINMGASLTYYYNIVEPGTYLYHCHVEATEHIQMGMLGNLFVRPSQDQLPNGVVLPGGHTHTQDPDGNGPAAGDRYVYNDGDASTRYDVERVIQLSAMDPVFHSLHRRVQPLPFAEMLDTYPMINGRGYPDTVNPGALAPPPGTGGKMVQTVSSLITANVGQKVLLRISSVATTDFYTLQVLGIPMRVVGRDARLLRGPTGVDLSYLTNSVTLGGGETVDAILDTAGLAPGTYFLYSTNLNHLSNNTEDFGGLMTEIVLNP